MANYKAKAKTTAKTDYSKTAVNIGGVANTGIKNTTTTPKTTNTAAKTQTNYNSSQYGTNTTANKNTATVVANANKIKSGSGLGSGSGGTVTTVNTTPEIDPDDYEDEASYIKALYDYGTYDSKYESTISDLLDQILNPTEFNIQDNADYNQLYNLYKQQYQNNARLAAQNAMAEGASLTGGYGNSVAQIASQQAYDNQMSNLNDQAYNLYNLAYQKYLNDQSDKYSQLETVMGLDSSDYEKWANDRTYYTEQDNTAWDRYNEAYQMAQDYAANGIEVPSTYSSILGTTTTNALNQLAAQVLANQTKTTSGSDKKDDDEERYDEPDENTTLSNTAGYKEDGSIDYIFVKGYGRLTTDEVEELIDKGKIKETYNSKTNKISYTAV